MLVDPVFWVKVTAPLAAKLVNAPVFVVTDPIGVFWMLPAYKRSLIPTPPVTTNVPEVVLVDPVFWVKVVAALLVNVVNAPVPLVDAPTFTLSIVPVVAGETVTTPVPVGLITTLALAGLSVLVPLLEVNVPPITVLFLTVVVPEVLPTLIVVAAWPILSVVAFKLNTVAVAEVVVKSPPFTATSPVTVTLPTKLLVP